MIRQRLIALAALAAAAVAGVAHADNYSAKDGSTPQNVLTFCSATSIGIQHPCHIMEVMVGGVPMRLMGESDGSLDVTVKTSVLPAGAATHADMVALIAAATAPAVQPVSLTAVPLAPGAAASSDIVALKTALGSPAQAGGKIDTVVTGAATDRGASVTSAIAVTLMPANPARRGFSVQNQSTGACYLNGSATATADFHSLQVPAGSLYETPPQHSGTGAISAVCPSATSGSPAALYSREF